MIHCFCLEACLEIPYHKTRNFEKVIKPKSQVTKDFWEPECALRRLSRETQKKPAHKILYVHVKNQLDEMALFTKAQINLDAIWFKKLHISCVILVCRLYHCLLSDEREPGRIRENGGRLPAATSQAQSQSH